MKIKTLYFLIFILTLGCTTKVPQVHQSGLDVLEKNPDKNTAITKQNLLQLAQVYDLQQFLYTKKVIVDSKASSHSHPVLTLSGKHADYPKKILSVFLHQEFHWWIGNHKIESAKAIKELKRLFPKAPSPKTTYQRLIVGYLELRALSYFLGNKEARGIIYSLMKKDQIYPWVYKKVLDKDLILKKIIQKNHLVPKILLEANKKTITFRRKQTQKLILLA